MCLRIPDGFDKHSIYITYAERIDKGKMNMLLEDYKVIGRVHFYIYDKKNQKWILLSYGRREFAEFLLKSNIKCYHGEIRCDNNDICYLCKIVEVKAFPRDGDYWIKTDPDDTKANNLVKE